jgi:hypothetical protein
MTSLTSVIPGLTRDLVALEVVSMALRSTKRWVMGRWLEP